MCLLIAPIFFIPTRKPQKFVTGEGLRHPEAELEARRARVSAVPTRPIRIGVAIGRTDGGVLIEPPDADGTSTSSHIAEVVVLNVKRWTM
jgi:hypothetical protein